MKGSLEEKRGLDLTQRREGLSREGRMRAARRGL